MSLLLFSSKLIKSSSLTVFILLNFPFIFVFSIIHNCFQQLLNHIQQNE